MILRIPLTSNSSGAGTATSTLASGYVQGVRVVLNGTHLGTNLTLAETGEMGRTILSLSGITASAQYNPTQAAQTTAGAAVTNGYTEFYLSNTSLSLVIASAPISTTDAVIVYVNIRTV